MKAGMKRPWWAVPVRVQVAVIYMAGLLGPFTGQSLAVVLPDVAETFGVSVGTASFAVTFYMMAFATVMLFSTRLVRNLRPIGVVLTAFAVIAAGAVVCLLSTSWVVFCIAFVVMGIANAFTTPVLQIMLRQIVPEAQLGASLGTFTAMQAVGIFSAPLVAGFVSRWNWQWLFLVIVVLSLVILVVRVPRTEPSVGIEKPGEKIHWAPTLVHIFTLLVVGIGMTGMSVVLALFVGEQFGLDSFGRGLVVMSGGLLAFLLARWLGQAADRFGVKPVLVACLAVSVVSLVLIPFAPWLAAVTVAWAVAIVASQGVKTAVTYTVLRSPGAASLSSTVQAFRFYGVALTPVIILPIYMASAAWAFIVPAALLVVVSILQIIYHPGSRLGRS